MKAVVLAGGYGTRLRPISYTLPKLLFPVLGRPIIYWTLDLLRTVGVSEVVFGVNYLAAALKAKVGSKFRGMKITYSLESHELGTAGPIKLASETTLLNETFIAMNGDVIAQIDLREMLRQHKETKALVTDALHEVNRPQRFGVVDLGPGNRIRRFVEKPISGKEPSHLVNAGIYAIEPSVLRRIDSKRRVSLEREIFPGLAAERRLLGFPFSGHWFDIGNLADYRRANFSLLHELAPETPRLLYIAPDASIHRPVRLGRNSKVEGKAEVGPNVLVGDNCVLANGAKVTRSILFDNVKLGAGSEVHGAIVASGVMIGRGAKVSRGGIISSNVTICDRVRIGNGAIVHPHKQVTRNVRASSHVM